jgi:hypothetical protein
MPHPHAPALMEGVEIIAVRRAIRHQARERLR